ncbi:MAG: FAD-binding oxidoreductase [Candidatus Thermoplasmatota archaeon]|nr:FAD-binding oxidoreductase [Candidatus Thermoplasmatota archaeon]
MMAVNSSDVIIVGAGSVGLPLSMSLGEMGFKVMVIDRNPSPGQGENKHAIGGIRATHSDPAKILTSLRSLEIFSGWEKDHGDDIEWQEGGYTFPVYREQEEAILKAMLPIQKRFGLNIEWVGPDRIREVVPGINPDALMGGTHSPNDGSASPLISANAFYRLGLARDVDYRFKENVSSIIVENGKVVGVNTDRDTYLAEVVVDAAGGFSRELARSAGTDIPVVPDSHEGAITEPVKQFFTAMVVDMRPAPGSKNYYFYQNRHGQIVFCITPDPPIVGTDKRETSVFLPQVAKRMVDLLPRLRNIRVRRVWRGLYPMSPDGSPLVGWNRDVRGLLHMTGMCGQGFMLGPGIGEVVARFIAGRSTENDRIILEGFDPYRKFGGEEALK